MREPNRIAASLDVSFVNLVARSQNEPLSSTREELRVQVNALFASVPSWSDLDFRVDPGYTNLVLPPPTVDRSPAQGSGEISDVF